VEPKLCGHDSNAKPRSLWNSRALPRSLHKKILQCISARSANEVLAIVQQSRPGRALKVPVERTAWPAMLRADDFSSNRTLRMEPAAFPSVVRPNRYSPPSDRARSRIRHRREIG